MQLAASSLCFASMWPVWWSHHKPCVEGLPYPWSQDPLLQKWSCSTVLKSWGVDPCRNLVELSALLWRAFGWQVQGWQKGQQRRRDVLESQGQYEVCQVCEENRLKTPGVQNLQRLSSADDFPLVVLVGPTFGLGWETWNGTQTGETQAEACFANTIWISNGSRVSISILFKVVFADPCFFLVPDTIAHARWF